jgi:hypothetical protein
MAQGLPTFEEIDKNIAAADLAPFRVEGVDSGKICAIYKIARPILIVISEIPLIPPKWREVVKVFISVMDSFCGSK